MSQAQSSPNRSKTYRAKASLWRWVGKFLIQCAPRAGRDSCLDQDAAIADSFTPLNHRSHSSLLPLGILFLNLLSFGENMQAIVSGMRL